MVLLKRTSPFGRSIVRSFQVKTYRTPWRRELNGILANLLNAAEGLRDKRRLIVLPGRVEPRQLTVEIGNHDRKTQLPCALLSSLHVNVACFRAYS